VSALLNLRHDCTRHNSLCNTPPSRPCISRSCASGDGVWCTKSAGIPTKFRRKVVSRRLLDTGLLSVKLLVTSSNLLLERRLICAAITHDTTTIVLHDCHGRVLHAIAQVETEYGAPSPSAYIYDTYEILTQSRLSPPTQALLRRRSICAAITHATANFCTNRWHHRVRHATTQVQAGCGTPSPPVCYRNCVSKLSLAAYCLRSRQPE